MGQNEPTPGLGTTSSRKVALARERRLMTPVLGVLVGALLYTSFSMMRAMQAMDEVKKIPFASFPNTVEGKAIHWVRNPLIRNVAMPLQPEQVTFIELRGGGMTGIPAGEPLRITDKELIRMYLDGLKSALHTDVLLTTTPPSTEGTGPDAITVHTKDNKLSVNFYADILPGSTTPNTMTGTISPEFQFALRKTGIPQTKQGYFEEWVLRTRVASDVYQAPR